MKRPSEQLLARRMSCVSFAKHAATCPYRTQRRFFLPVTTSWTGAPPGQYPHQTPLADLLESPAQSAFGQAKCDRAAPLLPGLRSAGDVPWGVPQESHPKRPTEREALTSFVPDTSNSSTLQAVSIGRSCRCRAPTDHGALRICAFRRNASVPAKAGPQRSLPLRQRPQVQEMLSGQGAGQVFNFSLKKAMVRFQASWAAS